MMLTELYQEEGFLLVQAKQEMERRVGSEKK